MRSKRSICSFYKGPFAHLRSIKSPPNASVNDISDEKRADADSEDHIETEKQRKTIDLFKGIDRSWCTAASLKSDINDESKPNQSSSRREQKLMLPKSKQHDQFIDVHGLRAMNAKLLFVRVYLLASIKKQSRIVWCIGRGNHSGRPSSLLSTLTNLHHNVFNSKFYDFSPVHDNPGQAIVIIKERTTPTISLGCKVPPKRTSK